MGKGYALIIGVGELSPDYNIEGNGFLSQPPKDANTIANIALKNRFDTQMLITKDATRKNVIEGITFLSKVAKENDLVFIYYSGHGSQVEADEEDEEDDKMNETWCLYDGLLIDNELHYLWRYFTPGVRIFFVSDSCHSGTMTKACPIASGLTTKGNDFRPKYISHILAKAVYSKNKISYQKDFENLNQPPYQKIKVPVLSFAGCEDAQYSYVLANSEFSLFTENFKKLLEDPDRTYTYVQALEEIKQTVKNKVGMLQTPYLFNTGNGDSFTDQTLLQI